METQVNSNQSLYALRNYTWYDKAVVRLWDSMSMKWFEGFLKNSECFSRIEFLTEIFKLYSWIDYWDYQYPKNDWSWANPDKLSEYWEFRQKFADLVQLSLDPWFMVHLKDFFSFMGTATTHVDTSCYNVREILSNYLWHKEMWKWLMLTESEVAEIKDKWIHSNLVNKLTWCPDVLLQFEAKVISTDIAELQKHQYRDTNNYTPFITLFEDRNTAISFWRDSSDTKKWKKFYLFKIKIPNIDLIPYSEPVKKEWIVKGLVSWILRNSKDKETPITLKKHFVFWKINPEEIQVM